MHARLHSSRLAATVRHHRPDPVDTLDHTGTLWGSCCTRCVLVREKTRFAPHLDTASIHGPADARSVVASWAGLVVRLSAARAALRGRSPARPMMVLGPLRVRRPGILTLGAMVPPRRGGSRDRFDYASAPVFVESGIDIIVACDAQSTDPASVSYVPGALHAHATSFPACGDDRHLFFDGVMAGENYETCNLSLLGRTHSRYSVEDDERR